MVCVQVLDQVSHIELLDVIPHLNSNIYENLDRSLFYDWEEHLIEVTRRSHLKRILQQEAQQLREKCLTDLFPLMRIVHMVDFISVSLNGRRDFDGIKQEVNQLTVLSVEEFTDQKGELHLGSLVSPDRIILNDVVYQLLIDLWLTDDTLLL